MRQQRGFTIMELLIAIAVLAIVIGLAVPNFRTFIQNNRVSGQANEMVASFQFARSEALKRGAPVKICSSSDGLVCGGDWSEGWIAIFDEGGADEVLRVWSSPGDEFDFTPQGGEAEFQNNGFSDAVLSVELDFDGCLDDNGRRVQVARSGRVGSERFDCTA